MSDQIPLSDPDLSADEVQAVKAALQLTKLSGGELVERFEAAFARRLGRRHAVAVASGTLGMLLALKAQGIGPGDEVITSSYSWRETAHAIVLAGARPVFSEIDYWSGTLATNLIAPRITERTKAIIAANTNGHPAPWGPLRELSEHRGIPLIEDSTEAIGSTYRSAPVGSFGRCSVFDFSHPAAITCGEGGMVATDDDSLAATIRHLRSRRGDERGSVVMGAFPPIQAAMSEVAAALGLAQLTRIDEVLLNRQRIEQLYYRHIRSFEGIKDPYTAPEADEVHWLLYVVHLGTRFTRSGRDAIVEDLRQAGIDAAAYAHPLHTQRHYIDLGHRRSDLPVTEKVADRALALPLHKNLSESQIAFIVATRKDASANGGAGAPHSRSQGPPKPHITLLPIGTIITAEPGTTLLSALTGAGVALDHRCGGGASCGTCHLFVQSGIKTVSRMGPGESGMLDAIPGVGSKSRLACQTRLGTDDIAVELLSFASGR
jgi:dTDP-4-amino-4,6-dideoxygalactose transaminase